MLAAVYPKADIINVLVDDTGGQDTAIGALAQQERLVIVQPPFNLWHQGALVFALRRLSTDLHDGRLNCVKLNGLELTDLEAKSFHI
ncbi:MAG: hypothetical protein P4L53_26300 [Candidatus Obscuribacterales bacterium]|nr:hypothetical protein [Candidatus Obscuribacterales bacterium]